MLRLLCFLVLCVLNVGVWLYFADKEKELHEAKTHERTTAVEKDEAEHTLRRFRDDGQLMVDNERRRLERELQFKKAHEDCVAQYESTVKAQVSCPI